MTASKTPPQRFLDEARRVVERWEEAPICVGDFTDLEAAIARALAAAHNEAIEAAAQALPGNSQGVYWMGKIRALAVKETP
jgi:hypothetical protein